MFARFKISIETVEKLLKEKYLLVESPVAATESQVSKQVTKLFSPSTGILNGDALQDDFFPTGQDKPYNVFICHSSRDRDVVEKFAGMLNQYFKVRCFVDSMVWKRIDNLKKIVDTNLPISITGEYEYDDILQSSAHVHSLLSIALFKMIDQCECCIFVGSKESLNLNFNNIQNETLSSWIYQEIYYMNHTIPTEPEWLKKVRMYSATEAQALYESAIKISHGIDLSHFRPLGINHFTYRYYTDGDEFLRNLYFETGVTNGKIIDKYGKIR